MNLDRQRWFGSLLAATLLIATGCAGPYGGHGRTPAGQLDELINRLEHTDATVTARVIELPSRRELYAQDIDAPFTPASNMKLPISAAGLDLFGADHTFKTYLAVDGDDLWIIGTGDPGLSDPRLAKRRGSTPAGVLDEWADALERRGIRRIAGDLYYYDGALDDEWLHPSWIESDLLHWYAAPVSGLIFNDNCVDITIHPTEADQPVRYDVVPPVQDITVINECVTGVEHTPTIVKLPGGNIYKLGGTCAKPAEMKSKPVEDPGAFTADALRTHLAARGIVVAGRTRRAPAPLGGSIPPPPDTIVAVHATSVRDIIGRINTNSQNLFAEALCKLTGQALAAHEGRQVPGSWTDGEHAIRSFLCANGIDDRRLVVADGSGLSTENKLTARLLTDLLAVMFAHPERDAFMASLAEGGVDGTLKKRFPKLKGRVFAKTGYIGGVRSLSGYARTRSGRWLAFSIIYNNIPGSVKPYEALQDEVVRLLAR